MAISAMGNKFVFLGLATCLLLSSFHDVSCQFVGGSSSNLKEEESESSKSESESEFSFEKSSMQTDEDETSSLDVDNSAESGALGDDYESSSMMDQVNDEVKAHFSDLNKQDGSDHSFGELRDASKFAAAGSSTKYVDELETSKENSTVETRQSKFAGYETTDDESVIKEILFGERSSKSHEIVSEGDEPAHDASVKHQILYGDEGQRFVIGGNNRPKSHKIVSEVTSSSEKYEWKKSNGGLGIMESLGLGQSGSWRCYNQDKNGVKEEEDAPIVIPKYDIDAIIKAESISQGSESKASSLVASLTKIVETHKNTKWTSTVEIGKKTRKSSETVRKETVETLKISLKKYRSLSVRDLVDHPQFEEILAIAARYEEVSLAKISYISRLSMYRSVIIEGRKASERVQLAENRIRLHKDIVKEKQSNVDAEFALVKALAQRGDMLKVKIFAIKKLISRLEAEKEEVDVKFQKTVGNLSRALEEASEAEENYHLVIRKWKEEKASAEYSLETIQSAEVVWVQFLSTLEITTN